MGSKLFRTLVLVLCLSLLFVKLTACGKMKDSNMNNSELLAIDHVIRLLDDNGAVLNKVNDFPVDLSLCTVSGKAPQPYISGESGVYYMFYEYDGYSETGDLVKKGLSFEYPDCDTSFSDYIIPGGIAGKNLYICQWFPELGSWRDTNEKNGETLDTVIKERNLIKNILYKNAFDEKVVTLMGMGEFWEVKIPVEYVYNLRESKKGIQEQLFASSTETFVKYLGTEKEIPAVYSMNWSRDHSELTLTYNKGEGSILNEEYENGFYKASSGNITDFNPETDGEITVTITWGNGETEKITCSIPKAS